MTRHQPKQKRSRERIEQILLAAADQLAKTGRPDDLTTTSVAKRSGVPVATIYRYFTNRMAIIAALIDREVDELDAAVAEAIEQIDVVTINSLFEAMMAAHLRHFQANRRAILLWFGTRKSDAVIERVGRRYERMAQWLEQATQANGMVRADAPPWGAEGIVWLSDRMFEFMFRVERSPEEQEAILHELIGAISGYVDKRFATKAGVEGVPGDVFTQKAGRFSAPTAESEPTEA